MRKLLVLVASVWLLPTIVFAATDFGSLQQSIAVGNTLSVGLNESPTGQWLVFSNSNQTVASAAIMGSTLFVQGISMGIDSISVCTDASGAHCMNLVVQVTGSVLGEFTSGHPVGSWLNDNGTVYYISDAGLVPVPDYHTFLSNGGNPKFLQPMTDTDMGLPVSLPLMSAHDSRVK